MEQGQQHGDPQASTDQGLTCQLNVGRNFGPFVFVRLEEHYKALVEALRLRQRLAHELENLEDVLEGFGGRPGAKSLRLAFLTRAMRLATELDAEDLSKIMNIDYMHGVGIDGMASRSY